MNNFSGNSDPGQSGISKKDLAPQVEDQATSDQRTIDKPVVTTATSSSKTTSEESSNEVQRNVRIDDTAKTSFQDTCIQGKGVLNILTT